MKKPNLFIIGAPKCATTALAQWLGGHPEVFVSRIKEPDYFYPGGRVKSLAEYEALFQNVTSNHKVIAEASVRYIYGTDTIPRILDYSDERPKFIVILRNPVEMAVSLHQQRYYSLNETEKSFEKAWVLQNHDGRPRQDLPASTYTPEISNYGPICKVGENLERVTRKIAGRADLLVLFHEDLTHDTLRFWSDVCHFCEIDAGYTPTFSVINRRKKHKFKSVLLLIRLLIYLRKKTPKCVKFGLVHKLIEVNSVAVKDQKISNQTLINLRRYFSDDVRKIERLTSRDLTHWLKD